MKDLTDYAYPVRVPWLLICVISLVVPLSWAPAASVPGPVLGWSQIDTEETAPGNRYFHAMTFDSIRQVALMHGGGPASRQWSNETWAFDGDNWSLLDAGGPELVLHAMAFDSDRGVAVLYGGLAPGINPMGETWEWNGQNWQMVPHSHGPGQAVAPAMVYDPLRKRVILHGGHADTSGSNVLSKTWAWDGSTWTEIAKGPPRAAHQIVFDSKRQVFVLFGGFSGRGSVPEDTWEFDGDQWQQVATKGPTGRFTQVMVYDESRCVTVMSCGGQNPAVGFEKWVFFDDTWEWDGHKWSEVSNSGPRPPALHGPAAAYDANRQKTILFGGSATGGVGTQETWEFTGPDPRMPDPADESHNVFRDATLTWASLADDVMYHVYFGQSRDSVQSARITNPLDVLVGQAQTETSYHPGRLDFDQTYYWRVDEVTPTPDNVVSRGAVWSFTTEPFVYSVSSITATASSTFGGEAVPANTVNGSGLTDDLHGTNLWDMWLSQTVPAWIEYEFDRPYTLHEMWIWNSNQPVESFLGFGAKDISIKYSRNGTDWSTLKGVTQLTQASGTEDYAPNNVIDFLGVTARCVRLTINRVHGVADQTGLSEVRFLHVPMFAQCPQPAVDATEETPDAVLSWRPGRQAASHQVFLSEYAESVLDGSALIATTNEPMLHLAGQNLKLGTTYYWKVNEINDLEAPQVHAGDLWHFNTPAFITIDDMEAYKDEAFLEIWAHWIDGVDDGENGSVVGNLTAFGTYLPERDRVYEGKQALPMAYDNRTATKSEATHTFDPPLDWTHGNPEVLSLFFSSAPPTFKEEDGSIFIGAAGTDIWDAYDEFRFVYKSLSGDGSITTRVDSLETVHPWSKAGVMIREAATPQAMHAMVHATGGHGIRFQARHNQRATATHDSRVASAEQTSTEEPAWVKLERKGHEFHGYYSLDGTHWKSMAWNPQIIPMSNDVLIGLAVTSHSVGETAVAQFSHVTTEGNVTGSWTEQAIGGEHPSVNNDPMSLYLMVTDVAGVSQRIAHPDPAATQRFPWEEWAIPISELNRIDISAIASLTIGVGEDGLKGEGKLLIDNIRVGTPLAVVGEF